MPKVYVPKNVSDIAENEIVVRTSDGEVRVMDASELENLLDTADSQELKIYALNTVLEAQDVENYVDEDDSDDDDEDYQEEYHSNTNELSDAAKDAVIDALIDTLKRLK